jgi:hypothetical protein
MTPSRCSSLRSLAILVAVTVAGGPVSAAGVAAVGPAECQAGAQHLCLGVFRLEVVWANRAGATGVGLAVPLGDDSGYFWFFDDANVELVVKAIDGRALNQHFWIFYGALSDVEYTLTVTNDFTGEARTYFNPQRNMASVADLEAFPDSGEPALAAAWSGEGGGLPPAAATAARALPPVGSTYAVGIGHNTVPSHGVLYLPYDSFDFQFEDLVVPFDGVEQDLPPYGHGLGTIVSIGELVVERDGDRRQLQVIARTRDGSDLFPPGLVEPFDQQPLLHGGVWVGVFDVLDWEGQHRLLGGWARAFIGAELLATVLLPDDQIGVPGIPWDGLATFVFPDAAGKGIDRVEVDLEIRQPSRLAPLEPCSSGPLALCLNGGRFRVEVFWKTRRGRSGRGMAQPLTADTGYFWFFDQGKAELVLKVLDGRLVNDHFWVFYGALSDVEYSIVVTDTMTRRVKGYLNPQRTLASAADIVAFPDA